MNIPYLLDRVNFVSLSFIILLSFILAFSSLQLTSKIYIHSQETNSSNSDEFLLSINQTYLSLIPLMIEEIQNTNASDIPIKQIMEATPSNATALQDIVKNNSNKTAQNEDNATLNNINNTSRPQDLIPVVVNMTQNTNASDIPIKNVIDTVPSNATALQDIVKNNSNKTAQNEDNATLNNINNTSRPQDLIPVVVNMTQNTNASDLAFMRIIDAIPGYNNSVSDNQNFPD
jgi:calcineurin-like phosphoesterase family protein